MIPSGLLRVLGHLQVPGSPGPMADSTHLRQPSVANASSKTYSYATLSHRLDYIHESKGALPVRSNTPL